MRRLRFFRVLLPVLLVLFLVVLVFALRPPQQAHLETPAPPAGDAVAKAKGVDFVEYEEGEKKLEATIHELQQGRDGSVHMETIESLKLMREGKNPLQLATDSGLIEGDPGKRQMTFDEPVTIIDDEDGLRLSLPNLQVDQEAGRADSPDAFEFESPDFSGRGTKLVYGLKGQPTELYDLVMEDSGGGTLSAGRTLLHDGFANVEFEDGVTVERGVERFTSQSLSLRRGPSRKPESAVALGGVSGTLDLQASGAVDFEGRRLDILWDAEGEPRLWVLDQEARIYKDQDSLEATSVKAERVAGDGGGLPQWHVHTQGPVQLRGIFGGEPALLRSARLEAVFNEGFILTSARASGRVTFDGHITRAEADSADFYALSGDIRLHGSADRKARLARGETRVAAEEIHTDARGVRLDATKGVEATLLPAPDGKSRMTGAMFAGGDAVHFVSEELKGRDQGGQLVFTGYVRGWQGDRNLSADRIVLDQTERAMEAEGNVMTRVPRADSQGAVSGGDFIQIRAGHLSYAEETAIATYTGDVRVRMVEGWVEAGRLEVELTANNEILEVRAFESVKVEFREPEQEGAPPTLISGLADRLSYRPAEQTVLLYGENAPASVRRIGEGNAKTSGRELRYRLDLGTLLVESGDEGPATIRTSG